MIQLFGNALHVNAYALYRPTTPISVAHKTIEFMKQNLSPSKSGLYSSMVDVGCGSGQSTVGFAPYFQKIIGIDPSYEQIEQAKKNNNHSHIVYKVGQAEDLGTQTNVDLIASGQAVHWMDFSVFFNECHRVLKPTGCLLIHGYDRPKLHPRFSTEKMLSVVAEKLFSDFYSKCLFHPRRKHVDNRYKDIFHLLTSKQKLRDDSIENVVDCSLFDFISYLKTWSGYHAYLGKYSLTKDDSLESDILEEFVSNLKKEWNINDDLKKVSVKVIWSIFVILSTRPSINKALQNGK